MEASDPSKVETIDGLAGELTEAGKRGDVEEEKRIMTQMLRLCGL